MRKIVKGLLYDTDKSTIVYEDINTNRILYKTENGHFFTLYPTGEITPKSEISVKELLGAVDVDKYVELFGEVDDA